MMVVCTDITRIMELEKQGQMMRGQFFASIAHELRTPLNSIIPILKMIIAMLLNADSLNVSKILKLIRIVHSSSIHLENVINDALDISLLENNKFEINMAPFSIREAVKDVYDIMKFQLDAKNLQFRLNIHESVPVDIISDQKRITQILFNLIGNAVKFTFVGEIAVDLHYERLVKTLTMSVRDTGVGIKMEDITKLFRFFGKLSSTKNINKGGMGLGLTISKLIIQ